MKTNTNTTPATVMPSRRQLLALPSLGLAKAPLAATRSGSAAPNAAPYPTLIVVFLRGGMDGLSLVAPTADTFYQSSRGALKVPPPPSGGSINLNGFFALGPAGQALYPLYQAGRLAFVHRIGAPGNSLSHFDANVFVESGRDSSNPTVPGTGWLGRFMDHRYQNSTQLLLGMNHGNIQPWTLRGAPKTLTVQDTQNYDLPDLLHSADSRPQMKVQLAATFGRASTPSPEKEAGGSTLSAISLFQQITNWSAAGYPNHVFGDQLRRTEVLLRRQALGLTGLDLRTVMLDFDGWDHHSGLHPLNNSNDPHGNGFFSMMSVLSQSLATFENNMQQASLADNYILLVMSEFGRRLAANGNSGGLDHGAGNCWLVMGAGVQGGLVHDQGWSTANTPIAQLLDGHGNLEVNQDYRFLLAEILVNRLGLPSSQVGQVFSGLNYTGGPGIVV